MTTECQTRRVGVTPGYIFAHVENRAGLSDCLECIEKVGRMEFAGIGLEILHEGQESIFADGNLSQIKGLLDRYDLRVGQFIAEYASADLFSLDRDRRNRGRDRIRKTAEICLELERARVIQLPSYAPAEWVETGPQTYKGLPGTVSMPPGAAYSDFWNAGLESIGECLEDLERTHLTFAIEPRPHTMFTTVDSVLRFVDRFDAGASPKVVLDTSHLQAQQEMIDVAIEKAAPVLAGVHLSDHSAANYREPLGAGSVNWDAVFGALKRIDYGGPLDLELYGNGIKDIDKDYLAGKAFVESMIR